MLTKVLLIDDSVTIHRVIDLSIDLEKFEITKVFSKDEATAKLSQSGYDYILLDNKLDNVHIIDYIKELKSAYTKCKVVLLVGAFDRFTDADLKITSADDFLVKPFDSQSLNSKLSDKSLPKPVISMPIDAVQAEANILDDEITEPVTDVEEVANITDDTAYGDSIDIADNDEIDSIIADLDNLNFDDVIAAEKPAVTEVELDDVIEFDEDDLHKVAEELSNNDPTLNPDEIIDDEIVTNKLLDTVLADADVDEDVTNVDDIAFDIPDIDMPLPTAEHLEVVRSDIDELASLEFIDDPNVSDVVEDVEPYIDNEIDKMRENLNLAFMNKTTEPDEIIDEPLDIEVEEIKKVEPPKKNRFSYLETDTIKKQKESEDTVFDDDTVHKELVGNVLYEEVMMPTFTDDGDENISTKPTVQPIKKSVVKEPMEDNNDDSKDLLYTALRNALSKEFIEDSIKDILAKNIKEAVKDIIPNLAEKYILEEIERLKEDEKED